MRYRSSIALLALAASFTCLEAAVIGASTAAPPLTAARIEALPHAQRAAWQAYLDRSAQQMRADRAALTAELSRAGMTEVIVPPSGGAAFH